MNYKKLILVGCISAFVAVLTSVMGVAGTIIGSVISSVLYNMLSEALEKPVQKATFSTNFEWEIAYVFPLIVIALIQLVLIFALLAEHGFLPHTFLSLYVLIQDFANNNLYRILGIALLVISVYPIVLKPEFVKKEHGMILVFVGLIFLARGFVDSGNIFTRLYHPIFANFDFPIAVIAFILLAYVIIRILSSARDSEKEFRIIEQKSSGDDSPSYSRRVSNGNPAGFDDVHYQRTVHNDEIYVNHHARRSQNPQRRVNHRNHDVKFKSNVQQKRGDIRQSNVVNNQKSSSGINRSSDKIHFESNDLLDEYKK